MLTKTILVLLDCPFHFLEKILEQEINCIVNTNKEQKILLQFTFIYSLVRKQEKNIFFSLETQKIHENIMKLFFRFKDEIKNCVKDAEETYKESMLHYITFLEINHFNFFFKFGNKFRFKVGEFSLSDGNDLKKKFLFDKIKTLSFVVDNKNLDIDPNIILIEEFKNYQQLEKKALKYDLFICNKLVKQDDDYQKDVEDILSLFLNEYTKETDIINQFPTQQEIDLYIKFLQTLKFYLKQHNNLEEKDIINSYNNIFCALPDFMAITTLDKAKSLLSLHKYYKKKKKE